MYGHAKRIFVQIEIRGSLEDVWRFTQEPELHQQWDLRFTEIQYLPRPDSELKQRFLYTTRIGMGLKIEGEGESIATRGSPEGESTSALKFWSADSMSLIKEGSGFWKYAISDIDAGVIQFSTGYDYRVRFGAIGRLIDQVIFRPTLGWATAWSFDRLRLWIEGGIAPSASLRQSIIHLLARVAVGLVWIYQGVIPKLMFERHEEVEMLREIGVPDQLTRAACLGFGLGEALLGLIVLFCWQRPWPLWLTIIAMPLALASVAAVSAEHLSAAFNPVTLNLTVFVLATIALICEKDRPSARRCLRQPPRD